MACQP